MSAAEDMYPKKRRFFVGRPLTTPELDLLIMESLDALEDASEDLADAAIVAARAEVNYRRAHAREYLLCSHRTNDMRSQHAINATGELLMLRKEAEARAQAAAEKCRTKREEIAALRTLASSARAAEHGK